jgi:hypothetical protein
VRITVENGSIVDTEGSGPPMLASFAARWIKANWKFNPTANGRKTERTDFHSLKLVTTFGAANTTSPRAINRHQAELNGLSGGSAVAIIGGLSALLVGTHFLDSAYVHWRLCPEHPATLPVWRQSVRFTFARSNPVFP